MSTYFISGIDTDIGKTIATAYLAKQYQAQGKSVITQKLIQTGQDNPQELAHDLLQHRQLMGIAPTIHDHNRTTCPYIFSLPASPHLAAAKEGQSISPQILHQATQILEAHYDIVFIEGAGGLMVPLAQGYTILDYIVDYQHPLILVSSAKLGSLNHTLLSLAACQARNIEVHTLLYNEYPESHPDITADTQAYLKQHLTQHFPHTHFQTMPYQSLA